MLTGWQQMMLHMPGQKERIRSRGIALLLQLLLLVLSHWIHLLLDGSGEHSPGC